MKEKWNGFAVGMALAGAIAAAVAGVWWIVMIQVALCLVAWNLARIERWVEHKGHEAVRRWLPDDEPWD